MFDGRWGKSKSWVCTEVWASLSWHHWWAGPIEFHFRSEWGLHVWWKSCLAAGTRNPKSFSENLSLFILIHWWSCWIPFLTSSWHFCLPKGQKQNQLNESLQQCMRHCMEGNPAMMDLRFTPRLSHLIQASLAVRSGMTNPEQFRCPDTWCDSCKSNI